MTRGDEFRARAAAAEASASTANAEPRLQFLDLAAKWRDFARQAAVRALSKS